MTNRLAINKIFLIPAGISVLVILPIIFIGLHDSTDLYQHIQFASTFYHSILAGDYYPSWSGEENFGYGSVGMRFYPPLFQFLLGLARIVTGDWHWAICVVLLVFSFAGVLGVYLWVREFISEKEAAVAASVFALMPYQLSQIYTSAFYAQFCAISVLPFAFLFVTRICRRGRPVHVVGLGVSLSIVILMNLPAAVIGCLSLLVYSLAMLQRQYLIKTIVKLSAGVVVALAATSFYWFRMYPELEFFRNTQFWADQTFNWREHFLLTQPSKVVFGIWFNNHTLITTVLLAICGIAGLSREERLRLRPVVILFFAAVFMMTPLSLPLWLYLPYLSEVQFPERWQIITSVTGSMIFGAGAFGFIGGMRNYISLKNPKIWLSALTIIAIMTVSYQLSMRFYKHLIPAGEFNTWCENDIKSLGFEFFWTLHAKKEAFIINDRIVAPERTADITEWKPNQRGFYISAGPAENVRIATLYYPHWKASINGTPAELFPADDGALLISVPGQESDIKIWFQEPSYVKKATYISVVVWLILLFGALYFPIANLVKSRNNFDAASSKNHL